MLRVQTYGSYQEIDVDPYGFSEAYEKLEPSAPNKRYKGKSQVRDGMRGYGEGDWYGGLKNSEEAIAIVREGWKEGAEKLKRQMEDIKVPDLFALTERARPTWGDDGDDLDPDKALSSQWDTAYRRKAKRQCIGPKAVTIESVLGGNCNVSAEEMFWTGAVMVIISDLLENAGFTTRLQATRWMNLFTNERSQRLTVAIKDFGEPLRIDSVAGVACHAGIYRTLGFQAIMHHPNDVGEGLARSCTVEEAICDNSRPYIEAFLKDHGEVIQCPRVRNAKEAIAEVRRIITEKVK